MDEAEIMGTKTLLSPREYIERVNNLYRDIRAWCDEAGLSVQEGDALTIQEEDVEDYQAPTLDIQTREGLRLASMIPIGLNIIGAEGRVDLDGNYGIEHLILYTLPGGHKFTEEIRNEGALGETVSTHLMRGVDEPGWYWLEDSRRRRALKLNQALLFDLLELVSNYERQKSL